MNSQSTEKMLNLGRYSFQTPERSSDLRVGSFWRRQQTRAPDFNSVTEPFDDDPSIKRLAITEGISNQCTSHPIGSVALQSTSLNSDTLTTISQPNDETSTNSANLSSDRLCALEDRLNRVVEKNSSEDISHTPFIDTQVPSGSTKNDDDTHESVVVNLSPTTYKTNENESGMRSRENIGNLSGLGGFMFYTPNIPKRMQKKTYPKQMPYDKIMSQVTFVMSGYENPRRSKLRDMALAMGAKYQPNWNRFCTHLICAFKNTPKFNEVMAENGRIVREHWIQDCSTQRQLLDWRNYKLGKYPYCDSEEEVDVEDLEFALKTGYGL